jgi:hypothetical protein
MEAINVYIKAGLHLKAMPTEMDLTNSVINQLVFLMPWERRFTSYTVRHYYT